MPAPFSILGAGSELSPLQQSLKQRGMDISLADKISPAGGGSPTPSPIPTFAPPPATGQNLGSAAPPPQGQMATTEGGSTPLSINESELIIKTLAARLKANSEQGK